MIHRTYCITYPRSGHHALKDVLAAYFGDEFRYCEGHREPEKRLAVCPETNYEKNHDFDLWLPIVPDAHYLIQVRNPLDSLVSYYDLERRTGDLKDQSNEARLAFFHKNVDYWAGFVKKWLATPIQNRLVVDYGRLSAAPVECCINVIQFLTGVQNVDMPRLNGALAAYPIARRQSRAPGFYEQA